MYDLRASVIFYFALKHLKYALCTARIVGVTWCKETVQQLLSYIHSNLTHSIKTILPYVQKCQLWVYHVWCSVNQKKSKCASLLEKRNKRCSNIYDKVKFAKSIKAVCLSIKDWVTAMLVTGTMGFTSKQNSAGECKLYIIGLSLTASFQTSSHITSSSNLV